MNLAKIIEDGRYLFSMLSQKEIDILTARYSINGAEFQTLAEIGVKYGITRERVRQIRNNCLKKMRRHYDSTTVSSFVIEVEKYISSVGGLLLQDRLMDHFRTVYSSSEDDLNFLLLLTELNDSLVHEHNKVNYSAHFRSKSISMVDIKDLTQKAIKLLKSCMIEMTITQMSKELKVDTAYLLAVLKISKAVVVNDTKVSLIDWTHINPRSLNDKINYVLDKIKSPKHYLEIAKLVNELKINTKTYSVNAVHNELIKNSSFVLIGRGIYASRDWGYKEGTVVDVIESILSKKGPMHLYDLTDEVLQRRKVKASTVKINLNSAKNKFRKTKMGLYELV